MYLLTTNWPQPVAVRAPLPDAGRHGAAAGAVWREGDPGGLGPGRQEEPRPARSWGQTCQRCFMVFVTHDCSFL